MSGEPPKTDDPNRQSVPTPLDPAAVVPQEGEDTTGGWGAANQDDNPPPVVEIQDEEPVENTLTGMMDSEPGRDIEFEDDVLDLGDDDVPDVERSDEQQGSSEPESEEFDFTLAPDEGAPALPTSDHDRVSEGEEGAEDEGLAIDIGDDILADDSSALEVGDLDFGDEEMDSFEDEAAFDGDDAQPVMDSDIELGDEAAVMLVADDGDLGLELADAASEPRIEVAEYGDDDGLGAANVAHDEFGDAETFEASDDFDESGGFAETDESGEYDESDDFAEVDESGEYAEVDESGDFAEIDESGDFAEVDESGEYAEVDESGDFAEVDESGDFAEVDESGDFAEADESGEYAEVDESGDFADEPPVGEDIDEDDPQDAGMSQSFVALGPPEIEPLPLGEDPPEDDPNSWLFQVDAFRKETRRLARSRRWRDLAAMTGYAILNADYATDTTLSGMLLDLARVYRDRLRDEPRAEEAFRALAKVEPNNGEALGYLGETYEKRGDWRSVYDLYANAVEATWDPNERLEWTQMTASIGMERLNDPSLAIQAWERLYNLGDAMEEASRELAFFYRMAGRWAEMAKFIEEQVREYEGTQRVVVMRELAEVRMSGMEDLDGAAGVLRQIEEMRPNDPIATTLLARIHARREDWDALSELGNPGTELPEDDLLARQHMVADALWQAGRLERASVAYDRILEAHPKDAIAWERHKKYLAHAEKFPELLEAMVVEIGKASDRADKATRLAEAAQFAEDKVGDPSRAVALWEQRVELVGDDLDSTESLARLYAEVENDEGVARALESQLELTEEGPARVQVLRQLGRHYAEQLGDDEKAERCWTEILSLDSTDIEVREELMKIHQRRGDFEALNSALMRQIWLTSDPERSEMLCRRAAENLDANFEDHGRSIAAWNRVLDLAPGDPTALEALATHYEALGETRRLVEVLEEQILAVEDSEARIALAMRVAGLWSELEKPRAAAAGYERILRWDPTHGDAVDGLTAIYLEHGQIDKALGALEYTAAGADEAAGRIELLERSLGLLPEDDHTTRFAMLRRILLLSAGDPTRLAPLREVAESGELWGEYASVLAAAIGVQFDSGARAEMTEELASVFAEKLDDANRAYLTRQSRLLTPGAATDEVLAGVREFAEGAGRYEDLLAVLDRLTTPELELSKRTETIRERATLSEQKLEDPSRAFEELRRLLQLDVDKEEPLQELERIAEEHNLWDGFDDVLAEIGDTVEGNAYRDLIVRREQLARERRGNHSDAFHHLLRRFRMEPDEEDTLGQVMQDADELEAWEWFLPLMEATRTAHLGEVPVTELRRLAELYSSKLDDKNRAFELYGQAAVLEPSATDLDETLFGLAEETERFADLALMFRRVAAISEDVDRSVNLLRRTAAIYEERLDSPDRAVEVHRRLLDLKDDEIASLDVMIAHHRSNAQPRDLRDRLRRWVEVAPEGSDVVGAIFEIATLSEESLKEPEAALDAYGEILEMNPEHGEARERLNTLVEVLDDPAIHLRKMRMDLDFAAEEDRPPLYLEIATLQEEQLDDPTGAIATLQALREQVGANGDGFQMLLRLLREQDRWAAVVEAQLDFATDAEGDDRVDALTECLEIVRTRPNEIEDALKELVYEAYLEVRASDLSVRQELAALYRHSGRFEELAELLQQSLAYVDDSRDRMARLTERARLLGLNLDKKDEASAVWDRIIEMDPDQSAAILAQARAALDAGDLKLYIERRRKHARMLAPEQGAYVLCHLAEVCDENEELAKQMVSFYRYARSLDPNNVPAREALKGIGRRLKQLRPGAALLPEEGEREMSWTERAARLKQLGDEAIDTNVGKALDWYRRAVAVDPDNPDNWEALADAVERSGNDEDAFRTRVEALQAVERTRPVTSESLSDEAQRTYNLGIRAKAAGDQETHERMIRRAHDIAPDFVPAAVAMAGLLIEEEDYSGARFILDGVLARSKDAIPDHLLPAVYHSRGLTLRVEGDPDEAMADFERALEAAPLHSEALTDLADAEAEAGRYAAALEHRIRALTVTQDPGVRAELYYRLGTLWEDGLAATDEAGACYEFAKGGGYDDRDLLHRVFRHFQRTGDYEQSLEVVDRLMQTSDDPDELANLWLARGEIYTDQEGSEDLAIEAYDMALSYDPGLNEARKGLAELFERSGDWEQLLEILDAIAAGGTEEQQAEALARMATISDQQLGDPERAEEYLRQSVAIAPSQEALTRLVELAGNDPARKEEQRELLSQLIAYGPPWYEHVVNLGARILDEEPRWAWAMLSPGMAIRDVDNDLKGTLKGMRREFERPPILTVDADHYPLLVPEDRSDDLSLVISEVAEKIQLGRSSSDEIPDADVSDVSPHSNIGKVAAAFAEAVDIGDITLHRIKEFSEPVAVVNGEEATEVLIRADVFQQMARAEIGFVLGYALELARPEHRAVAAMTAERRKVLVPALWRLLDFRSDVSAEAEALAEQLREVVDLEEIDVWAVNLLDLSEQDPEEVGRLWWRQTQVLALRAGILAGPDLTQAFRAMSRMYNAVDRPSVFGSFDDFDEYLQSLEFLSDLVTFVASPAFGELIANASEIDS